MVGWWKLLRAKEEDPVVSHAEHRRGGTGTRPNDDEYIAGTLRREKGLASEKGVSGDVDENVGPSGKEKLFLNQYMKN